MSRDAAYPIDETAAIESLDRTLESLSDDHLERADAPRNWSSALAGTAVALRALDDARPPDPTFVAHLEEQLMSAIAVDHTQPRPTAPPGVRSLRPTGRRAGPRRPLPVASRRRGLVEVFSFAALLALLLAQTIGFGGNLAFWRQDPGAEPTPTRPITAQGDQSTPTDASPTTDGAGAVALERGNPGRTGVYGTSGPEGLPALLWRYTDPNGEPQDVLEPIVAGDTVHFSILRGTGYAVTPFSLPAGEGGFATWLFTSDDRVNVAFGNGLLFAASSLSADREAGSFTEDPALVAYDQVTFEERWRVEVDFAQRSSPVVAGETVVVLANDALIALDAGTGAELWRAPIAETGNVEVGVARNPAVEGDTVVINEVTFEPDSGAGRVGTLRAFDLATGEERWSVASEGGYFNPAAVSDGMVYAYEILTDDCCGGGRLWAVDLATGEVAWRAPGAKGETLILGGGWGSPVVDATSVYSFERESGATATTLTARDTGTGEVRWQRDVGDQYGSQISLADGVLYYTMDDGAVYAAGAEDGAEIWRIDTGDVGLGTPIPAGGYLVMASRTAVYAFGPAPDASDVETDVSGLSDCESPRTLADPPPTGEPALSLVGLEDNPLGYGVPTGGRMLLADVPDGDPADDAAVAGIYRTLREMTACARPGSELELAGFYSDDYFRRFDQVELRPGRSRSVANELFPVATLEVGDLGAPFILPDGRVALLAFDPLGDRGALLVFVEEEGAWLIDEVVEVGRDPEVWRQG